MSRVRRTDYMIRMYTGGNRLPQYYRDQILDDTCWSAMCRSAIPWEDGTYPENALSSAQIILLATVGRTVVGFLCGLTSSFVSPLTETPVANPYEWYLDVVCALEGGHGGALIRQFMIEAKRAGMSQIRLYSVEAALGTWDRYGFRECDDSRSKEGRDCYRKVYAKDPAQGVRMTRALLDICVC